VAFLEAARGQTRDATAAANLVAAARAKIDAQPVGHRAEADARREWAIWRAIVEAA